MSSSISAVTGVGAEQLRGALQANAARKLQPIAAASTERADSAARVAIGLALGTWAGGALTELYARFYSFPVLVFSREPGLYLIAGGTTMAAAVPRGSGTP